MRPTYQQPAPQQQYAPISPPQGGFGPNNGGYQPTPRYNYPPAAQNGGWNQR